jgi:hypothetical protein
MGMLVCCGGLAALGALFYTRAEKTVGQVKAAIQQPANPPLIAPAWQSEWIATAQLTPVYSAAVDAVAEDAKVLEKLGEPIETVNDDTGRLFRRQKSGDWDGTDETFEFDIQGPKAKAVVRVVGGAELPEGVPPGVVMSGPRAKSIVVVLEDGTELDVTPRRTGAAPGELN